MDFLIGQIILGTWRTAPKDLMLCNGATLQINSYQALYSLIGNTYGGDGRTTFMLPNLVPPTATNQTDTAMIPRYYMVVWGVYPDLFS